MICGLFSIVVFTTIPTFAANNETKSLQFVNEYITLPVTCTVSYVTGNQAKKNIEKSIKLEGSVPNAISGFFRGSSENYLKGIDISKDIFGYYINCKKQIKETKKVKAEIVNVHFPRTHFAKLTKCTIYGAFQLKCE